MEEMLKRLKAIDSDGFGAMYMIIERYTENTERLNMLLDAIPKVVSSHAGISEEDARNIIPDLFECKTSDEMCELINRWIKDQNDI